MDNILHFDKNNKNVQKLKKLKISLTANISKEATPKSEQSVTKSQEHAQIKQDVPHIHANVSRYTETKAIFFNIEFGRF
jgi:hypothetical protein